MQNALSFKKMYTLLGLSCLGIKLQHQMWGNVWGKMVKKALESTTCSPRIQRFSGGGSPNPPARNHNLQSSFNNLLAFPAEPGITVIMHFSDFFFASTHSDIWVYLLWFTKILIFLLVFNNGSYYIRLHVLGSVGWCFVMLNVFPYFPRRAL